MLERFKEDEIRANNGSWRWYLSLLGIMAVTVPLGLLLVRAGERMDDGVWRAMLGFAVLLLWGVPLAVFLLVLYLDILQRVTLRRLRRQIRKQCLNDNIPNNQQN